MPYANSEGASIYWDTVGEAAAPPLLLLNSLGTTTAMWDDAITELASDFLVIRTDTRGHGRSDVSDGDYSIDLLARDVLVVLDAAGVDKAAVCGLSLGALVAVHMAKTVPERMSALILCNIAVAFNPPDWLKRAETVRTSGIEAIVDASISRFLTDAFRASQPSRTKKIRDALASINPQGYAACCTAIANATMLPTDLGEVDIPLLSIGGSQDVAAPPEHAKEIADSTDGRLCLLDSGHLSASERPSDFSQAVRAFLKQAAGATSEDLRSH